MNHRHLLPNEIDLLVDGEAGFGVAPLRAHIDECALCRLELEREQVLVNALERLPHFAPDSRLADRVMAQVPLFVPAHVVARDSVLHWLPQTTTLRIAAATVFASVAGAMTLAMVWLAAQGDAAVFATSFLGDRLRDSALGAARDVAVSLLGETALAAVRGAGAVGVGLLSAGFFITALGTFAGVRRLALAGRR